MDLSDVLKLLESDDTQKSLTQDNPYFGALSIPQAIKIEPGKYSLGEELTGNFVKGLLGGAGTTLAENYQDKLTDEYKTALMSGVYDKESAPNRLSKSLFGKGVRQGGIFRQAEKDEARSDAKDIYKSILQAELLGDVQSDKATRQLIIEEFIKNPGKMSRLLGEAQAPIVQEEKKGPASYTEKIERDAARLMDSGAPPGVAYETARAANAGDKAQLTRAEKEASDIRSKASRLSEVAAMAESAVSRAGETGGPAPIRVGRDIATWLASFVSNEQQEKLNATAEIESLGPDILAGARVPGSGATSDKETEMFLKSGVTNTKTPGQNKALIEKAKNLASLQQDYADFLDFYREKYQTATGAQKIWEQYKQQNPIFINDDSGELNWNSGRASWEEWLADPESAAMKSQSAIVQRSGPPAGVPFKAPDGKEIIIVD
jgi:hypothetical protein